jgi:hypothetical protein
MGKESTIDASFHGQRYRPFGSLLRRLQFGASLSLFLGLEIPTNVRRNGDRRSRLFKEYRARSILPALCKRARKGSERGVEQRHEPEMFLYACSFLITADRAGKNALRKEYRRVAYRPVRGVGRREIVNVI